MFVRWSFEGSRRASDAFSLKKEGNFERNRSKKALKFMLKEELREKIGKK